MNSPTLQWRGFRFCGKPSVAGQLAQGDFVMHSKFTTRITVLAFVFACVFASKEDAECGDLSQFKPGASLQPQSWQGMGFGRASLLQVSDTTDPIVGFWQVTLTAKGNQPPGPPDGVQIDKGFSQWHSDGTEILNSSRAPATQSFLPGSVEEGWYFAIQTQPLPD